MALITVDSLDDAIADDGEVTLREAIQAANNDISVDGSVAGAGADEIQFAPGLTGTITLEGTALEITEALTLSGPGANNLTINANGASRVIEVTANVPLTVDGLRITGGRANLATFLAFVLDQGDGGGIVSEGNVTVTNSIISGNSAEIDGGGVYSIGNLTVTNSTISGNTAEIDGGGIGSNGNLTVTNSTVSSNTSMRNGGGIANTRNVTVTNSTISGNTADFQAGGIGSNGNVTVTNSTVSGNTSMGLAGGIGSQGDVTVTNSTVSGNRANRDGGGIIGTEVTLANSTVSGNRANANGGGIYSAGGTIENSTITRNVAGGNGGGIFRADGTIALRNSIIAGNTQGNGAASDVSGDNINGDSNNILGSAAGNGSGSIGTGSDLVLDTSGLTIAEVLNATLGNNGGSTQTHAIVAGSPAIDASGGGATASDQRGVAAVGTRDIGAFESPFDPTTDPADLTTDPTIDDEAILPTLTSITRNATATEPTDADILIFRATFDEDVQNVDITDFLVNGTTTATIAEVNPVSASEYDITVSGGDLTDFNGIVGLDLAAEQNITDLAGNVLPNNEPAIDETYTLENATDPTDNPTDGSSGDTSADDSSNSSGEPENPDDNSDNDNSDSTSEPLLDVRLVLGQLDVFLPAFPATGICGNDSDDLLLGDETANVFCGLGGNDTLAGFGEADRLDGDDDSDIIFGNTGNDTIDGGTGDDSIYAGKEDDLAIGGAGMDVMAGDIGSDTLDGNTENDILFGNTAADVLDGDDGDDLLFGGRDNDIVTGGAGNDVIRGDFEDDLLIGGAGSDRFEFRPGDGTDIVADFADGVDTIGLIEGLTFEELAIVQVGNDTQITATGLVVTLQGIDVGAIDVADFAVL
ncbi:MAG: choice-of-anchor Q domain-containing protein [Cyanobacteriota bacterium]|nr:choice-of-anchor Q domain-containing protein [Cyanobacteriota bacterium]